MRDPSAPLSMWAKMRLLARVWITYARVVARSRQPLPRQVRLLSRQPRRTRRSVPPIKISRAIHLGLRAGSVSPRCLPNALVMYRLLIEQGETPELVIGLPNNADSHIAHAWIELSGRDVGPPPGKGNHQELARYP